MTLGVYMCARRRARGLSQQALARRCRELEPQVRGISQASITGWETGHRNIRPSLAQFDVLADVLELDAEERLLALRLARSGAARV